MTANGTDLKNHRNVYNSASFTATELKFAVEVAEADISQYGTTFFVMLSTRLELLYLVYIISQLKHISI